MLLLKSQADNIRLEQRKLREDLKKIDDGMQGALFPFPNLNVSWLASALYTVKNEIAALEETFKAIAASKPTMKPIKILWHHLQQPSWRARRPHSAVQCILLLTRIIHSLFQTSQCFRYIPQSWGISKIERARGRLETLAIGKKLSSVLLDARFRSTRKRRLCSLKRGPGEELENGPDEFGQPVWVSLHWSYSSSCFAKKKKKKKKKAVSPLCLSLRRRHNTCKRKELIFEVEDGAEEVTTNQHC